jgi:hypothetical protein
MSAAPGPTPPTVHVEAAAHNRKLLFLHPTPRKKRATHS